jgi:hypothetical protein
VDKAQAAGIKGGKAVKQGNTKATEKAKPDKKVYVPPPPPDGAKILPPAGMPVVKTFPITDGPPPANMKFPNIDSAPPPTKADPGAGGEENKQEVGQDDAEPADDGFTPEQRRRIQLEEDPDFRKYRMMYRNKIPLFRIIDRINGDGQFTAADIKMFATQAQIDEADNELKI